MSESQSYLTATKAKTWEAFKHFTEARDAYRQYQLNGKEEELDNAWSNAIQAVQAEPDYELNFGLLSALGLAYEAKGDPRAEEMFRYAAERVTFGLEADNSELSDAYALLGWSQVKKGDVYSIPEAIFALQKATNHNPDSAFAWANLGIAYDAQGRFDKAVQAHETAVHLDAEGDGRVGWLSENRVGGQGLATSAWWLYLRGYYDEAKKRCRWTIAQDTGEESYPPHVLMSNLLTQEDRFEEALELCRQAMKVYRKSTDPITAIIDIHVLLGEDDEAYTLCQEAICRSPRDAYPWLITGMIYHLQHRYDSAMRSTRRRATVADRPHIAVARMVS